MASDNVLTAAGAALHFLVDGLCVCCLYQVVGKDSIEALLPVFLTYNIFAFLTQPLTGMLADRLRPLDALLAAAMSLLAVGVMLTALTAVLPLGVNVVMLAVSATLGMGNSLFHVWGGKAVAVGSGNDVRSLGVFVSTGAMGLAVGVVCHGWALLFALLLAMTLLALFVLRRPTVSTARRYHALMGTSSAWLVVVAVMVFVALRSLSAEMCSSRLSVQGMTVLAVAGVAMLGKMGGGWIAHWTGTVRALVMMALGAWVCLWNGSSMTLLLAGLFLVNATMSVTLYWANRALCGCEGLAFGLLAASLMPGYLLANGGGTNLTGLLVMLVPTIVIELLVLWLLNERRPKVLWSAVVVNMLTNVPLNLLLQYYVGLSLTSVAVAEAVVLLAETAWYRYFVERWRTAFIYSFLCNAISCLTGFLAQLLWILFTIIFQKSA